MTSEKAPTNDTELERLVQEIIRLAQEINALSDQLNERIEALEDRLTQAGVGIGAEGISLPNRWELGYHKLGDRWCFIVTRDGEKVALLKASRSTRQAAWEALPNLLKAIIERQKQVRDSLLSGKGT